MPNSDYLSLPVLTRPAETRQHPTFYLLPFPWLHRGHSASLPHPCPPPPSGWGDGDAATSGPGDPPATVLPFSPSLAAELLSNTARAVEVWPALEELRAAAHATKPSLLRLVTSALVAEARLVFGACFLLARGNPPPRAASPRSRVLHYSEPESQSPTMIGQIFFNISKLGTTWDKIPK